MDILKKVVNKEKKFFGDNKKGAFALFWIMDRRGERAEGAAGFQQYGGEEGRVEEGDCDDDGGSGCVDAVHRYYQLHAAGRH